MYCRSFLTDRGDLPLYGSMCSVTFIPYSRAESSKTGITGSGGGPSSSERPAGYQDIAITPILACLNWCM